MAVSLDYEGYDLGSIMQKDAEEAIESADLVVLPRGSVEQHSATFRSQQTRFGPKPALANSLRLPPSETSR